ncbi:unnamed protein product [Rotaria socialis]|uniref:Uncharacterized protein n=1 Tax=Rotaria socialis TaxID=392032 RepID=A0A818VAF9_9BILA|nr:unnamed protein product [Rotaria socialis]
MPSRVEDPGIFYYELIVATINKTDTAAVSLPPMNATSVSSSTTTAAILTTTAPLANGKSVVRISHYSGVLTTSSSTFTRNGRSGTFYFDAIEVTPKRTGNYTFTSNSRIDNYGYLYANPFNPLNTTSNLLTHADDNENETSDQFSLTCALQADTSYTLVFTTFDPDLTGPFSIFTLGPSRISLRRLSILSTFSIATTFKTPVITVASNYSSALDMNSNIFSRNGRSGTFYFEAIAVTPKRTGNYTFKSYSTIDSYGYLYTNPFDPLNTTSNLLTHADDNEDGTSDQFSLTCILQAGTSYTLIFTTFDAGVTGLFSVVAVGPGRVSLLRKNITPVPVIASNYSGALNNNSPTFSRDGTSDIWYYEAIQAIPKRTGNYTFKSYSAIDSYGYLYANPFDPLNIASNLLASSDDDETGIDDQFSMSYPLEAGANYNLIFTTFDRSLTGRFFIVVSGPARVILRSMNTTLKQSSTTTSTTVASRCKYYRLKISACFILRVLRKSGAKTYLKYPHCGLWYTFFSLAAAL